jgi:hypothetical protein
LKILFISITDHQAYLQQPSFITPGAGGVGTKIHHLWHILTGARRFEMIS